jgi:hypothetical protein
MFRLVRGHAPSLVCTGVCLAPGIQESRRGVEKHGGLCPLYHAGCPLPSGDFSAQLCRGRYRGRAPCPGVSHPLAAGGVVGT